MIRPDFREIKTICNDNNEPLHYGVKGMRWGFRKSKKSYQSTGRKRKPGRTALKRLNYAKAGVEYNKISQQRHNLYNERRPSKNKFINSYRKVRDRTIQGRIDKFSKKFDDYLNRFEESGVDLSARDAIIYWGDRSWIGEKYYINK